MSIARAIELEDPIENAGAQLIKEVCVSSTMVAGLADGYHILARPAVPVSLLSAKAHSPELHCRVHLLTCSLNALGGWKDK